MVDNHLRTVNYWLIVQLDNLCTRHSKKTTTDWGVYSFIKKGNLIQFTIDINRADIQAYSNTISIPNEFLPDTNYCTPVCIVGNVSSGIPGIIRYNEENLIFTTKIAQGSIGHTTWISRS